jgi:hypothetical protein
VRRSRWVDLRSRVAARPGLRAGLAAAAGTFGTPRSDADKSAAAAVVWSLLRPWCLVAGNLEALTTFVEEATADDWLDSWMQPRANVARFRVLLDFYSRLTTVP